MINESLKSFHTAPCTVKIGSDSPLTVHSDKPVCYYMKNEKWKKTEKQSCKQPAGLAITTSRAKCFWSVKKSFDCFKKEKGHAQHFKKPEFFLKGRNSSAYKPYRIVSIFFKKKVFIQLTLFCLLMNVRNKVILKTNSGKENEWGAIE